MRPFPRRSSPVPAARRLACALLLVLAALPAAAQETPDPFDAARERFGEAEGFEARMAIVKEFLADHPDHPRAPDVVQAGARLYLDERDGRGLAAALAERHLMRVRDAEVADRVRHVLLDLYGHPDHADQLRAMVEKHFDPEALNFGDHLAVLDAATEAEDWPLVVTRSQAALGRADAASFVADYADRDLAAEEAEEAGRNRAGLVHTYLGWARANQDLVTMALDLFARAERELRPSFTGVPGNALYRYWGQALLMNDAARAGLEKLTLAAVFGPDEEAAELAREHFDRLRPEEDYAEYRWTVRLEHAPDMIDFAATDYEGELRAWRQLRGREVTLLAFWFPT